jgi:hypothetical protein
MTISNLHWICSRCGEMRDANAAFDTTAGPVCCDAPMQRLSHIQSEAARRLTAPERLTWLQRGGHVLRDPGRRWRPAVSDYQIKEAVAQLEAHTARSVRPPRTRSNHSKRPKN